jgi:hypothetical protein
MAEVASKVIGQARAGNTAAQAQAAAAGSAHRLAELEQVAAGFAAARTSTTVARLVVDRGLRALDAQAGLIGLNNADGQALELVAWAGYPVQVVAPWRRIPLAAPTPLTEVARNGGAIWVSTTEEFQARYPAVPVVVEHQAHAAIGLVVEGRRRPAVQGVDAQLVVDEVEVDGEARLGASLVMGRVVMPRPVRWNGTFHQWLRRALAARRIFPMTGRTGAVSVWCLARRPVESVGTAPCLHPSVTRLVDAALGPQAARQSSRVQLGAQPALRPR